MRAVEIIGDGGAKRLPDGRVVFRAKDGTLSVKHPDGRIETTTSTSFTDLPTIVTLTEQEAQEMFDRACQRRLGMSGEEFLRRWDAGEWPDPDAVPGVFGISGLISLVRPGG